jgi:hypothetical protein
VGTLFERLAIAASCLLATQLAAGQSFEQRYARDLTANPSDLHFRLDIEGARRTFQLGERIPILLSFASDTPRKYKLNGATYDRSGRLPTEEFVTERDDVTDPYRDYFRSGVMGWIGGGIRSDPVLEQKPFEIHLDLNSWFRFDSPGAYRLYLESHRLSREREAGETGEQNTVAFAATSNIVELEITDDPQWRNTKLAEIRAILEQPEPKPPANPLSDAQNLSDALNLSDTQDRARRELEYLGTPGAVELAFEFAHRTSNAPGALFLTAARDRAQMVSLYDAYLAASDVGFSAFDIRLRAMFSLPSQARTFPVFVWQDPQDPAEQAMLRKNVEARQKVFEELAREQAIRLIASLASKEPAARKASAAAIAELAPEAARSAGIVPPDDYGLTRAQLISQFPQFPDEQKAELLGQKWDLVRGREMIPVLKRVLEQAVLKPAPMLALPVGVWGTAQGAAENALRRLMELSPQEATRVIRADLTAPNPRFAAFDALEFPPQDIPEGDANFTALLKSNFTIGLALTARFGTSALAGQMKELYGGKPWACRSEEHFMTYFARTLPPDESRPLLKHAMVDRGIRACYRTLIGQVANVVWNDVIEQQASATLDDPDLETAADAARALSSHGSAKIEPLLWERLEQWSEKWRGRAQELEVHPITGTVPNAEARLGTTLFESIAQAQGWVLDEPRQKRLLTLCIDDSCRKRWTAARANVLRIDVANGGGNYPATLRVGSYAMGTLEELKSKIAQFPVGTTFCWSASPSAFSAGQLEDMFHDLSESLTARSIRLERYSDTDCGGTQ